MTDGAFRLVSHKAEEACLAQLQSELAAQRREDIGQLAGWLGVLETEDCVLAGQCLELQTALANSSLGLANRVMRVFRSLHRRSNEDTARMLGSTRLARAGRNAEGSYDHRGTKG